MERSITYIAFGFAMIVANAASAQLVNSSFETTTGEADLTGWIYNCLAQSANEGAPISGDWSAEVEASNPQGCWPSLFYQVVPSAYDGMPFYLGGWCRNVSGPWMPLIGLGIGVMDAGGGITATSTEISFSDSVWTWLYVNDTIHLGPGEQAVVICGSGVVGGPGFALARFDGIQFFETFPFAVHERPSLTHVFDAANGILNLASTSGRITDVRLSDALGRTLPMRVEVMSPTSVRMDIGASPAGVYLLTATTDKGMQTIRFVTN